MSSGSDTSSSSENTGSDKSSISENNSGKSSPTKSHSELTAKTYSHNYQNVAYEKIDEKTVIMQGKVYKKRKLYNSFLYFACANTRKNEENKVLYAHACKSTIKISQPINQNGIADLIKPHIDNCGKKEGKILAAPLPKDSKKNDKLIEKITKIIEENPTIKPQDCAKMLNETTEFKNYRNIDLNNIN